MDEFKCIKTGANVLLDEYGFVLHGDLFRLGDMYLFQFNNFEAQQELWFEGGGKTAGVVHATVHHIAHIHKDRGILLWHAASGSTAFGLG